MCGIVGVYHQKGNPVSPVLLRKMTDIMAYRGPDDEGQFIKGNVGLGHRRLSVLDLSPAGHQPMANQESKVVVVYNGEIFNFQEIRSELEALGYRFRSRTDTEVLLHAYEEWGEDCVARFNGMFAFAIWDREKRRLFLARDRFGIKPLYWTFQKNCFVFASEIKAILEHPKISRRVSLPALNEYFTFQNIFSDLTLFDGIHLLPPGHTLHMPLSQSASPEIRQYWDFPISPQQKALREKEYEEQLFNCFSQAVNRQLISDVQIGAYLSGGMDSGSIVAIAGQSLGRLSTFTGGFDISSASGLELGCDERKNSESLSNLLKTEHYEMVLHAGDMEHIMPELIWHLEDLRVGQCYPNYYIARLAGKFVKVVISGTGGDELFGGYPWRYYRGMNSASQEEYERNYYQFWQRLVTDEEKKNFFAGEMKNACKNYSAFDVFRNVFKGWAGTWNTRDSHIHASLYFELKTFLHGLLLVEDKLSMAHSLETRVPFLDNDLVDLAMAIPVSLKINQSDKPVKLDENIPGKRILFQHQHKEGKAILRRTMSRLIPRETTERTKQGFSAPDASWFRGESIQYIKDILGNRRAKLNDFISRKYIENILEEHCSGKSNKRLLIWSLLSFEWWLRKFSPS